MSRENEAIAQGLCYEHRKIAGPMCNCEEVAAALSAEREKAAIEASKQLVREHERYFNDGWGMALNEIAKIVAENALSADAHLQSYAPVDHPYLQGRKDEASAICDQIRALRSHQSPAGGEGER